MTLCRSISSTPRWPAPSSRDGAQGRRSTQPKGYLECERTGRQRGSGRVCTARRRGVARSPLAPFRRIGEAGRSRPQTLAGDADYQRIYGELTRTFELQEGFVSVVEDL